MTKLNTKGGSISKTKRVLVIVCSNFDIEECYHKVAADEPHLIDALKARFIE